MGEKKRRGKGAALSTFVSPRWTREHPDRPIRIGCAILAINGEDQIEPMLEQLDKSCKMDLLITAELTASQQQKLYTSLQKTVPSFVVESFPRY